MVTIILSLNKQMFGLKRKILPLQNYFYYGFAQIINIIAPLVVAPQVIRVCGMENWGKVGVALSVFTILAVVIDFGSNVIGVREISIHRTEIGYIKTILDKTYNLRILLFFFIIALLIIVNLFFITLDKLYFFGILFLIAQLINPMWYYQGIQDFKTINRIIFISKIIYIVLILFIITKPDRYVYFMGIFGIANIIGYIYYFLKIKKEYDFRLFNFYLEDILKILQSEYPIIISNLSISFYINTPIIIVKQLLGDHYAGIYKLGEMFLTLMRNYLSVFFNVSFPKFCQELKNNTHKGFRYLYISNAINLSIVLFGIILSYFLVPVILTYFYPEFERSDDATYIFNFLPVALVVALNIPFNQILMYFDKIKGFAVILIFNTILNVLLCFYLTKKIGANGALISVYISECLVTAMIIGYWFKENNYSFKINKE